MPHTPTTAQRLAARARPQRPFVMRQTWRDLLFLHWEIDAAAIQATLPPGLYVDTFDDPLSARPRAFVGLVPFVMARIRPRWLPPVPWISWFLETNVRTYVHDDDGTPGVWFYSLDANQPLAVLLARRFFQLPYVAAQMRAWRSRDGWTRYSTQRRDQPAATRFSYRPWGTPATAATGSLDFFLIERYVLFAQTRRGLRKGIVHHPPYAITPATVTQWDTDLIARAGLPAPKTPPVHVCASPGVTVDIFPLTR